MHELSVIMAVIDTVEEYIETIRGEDGPLPAVTRVTLQIGDRSSYLPDFIREIWPVAVKGTALEAAALETENTKGRDFLIKEIEIEE